MDTGSFDFSIVDNRFLSRSVSLLNPPTPHTLTEDQSLESAIKLLKDNKMGCVVVTDNNGKVDGIFTERDVLLKVDIGQTDLSKPLLGFMTKNPESVNIEASIGYVLQLMSRGGYRHMPVVTEDNTPVGIISVKDIVDYIVKTLAKDF